MRIAPEYRGRGRFTERVAAFVSEEQAHEVWLLAAQEGTTQAAVVRQALAEFLHDDNDKETDR